MPTLLLQNRNFETIGSIGHVHNLMYQDNYNSANELSFSIYKTINGKPNPVWDSVTDFKIIYIPEFEERFEINTSMNSNDSIVKSITATSLCESELSQVMLYDIEINTETDILNNEYDENFPTVFYRNPEDFHNYDWNNKKYQNYTDDKKREVLKKSSLLHRILEKAEHYSIGTVDASLQNIIREFSISNTDIYSELTGEISEEFNCIFIFDSMTRTVSAYDLYNTCRKCGYRGDFSDHCPECGSLEFDGQYGEDTTIFISNENLAQEISLETNKDSLKNCFYVEGGDDLITSAVRSTNPNGTNYIYEYNEDIKADMPKELSSTIEAYDKLYRSYLTEITFPLDSAAVDNYNHVVQEINLLFKEDKSINFPKISQNLAGYPSVVEAIYEAIDLYQFLQNSMMPTINIDGLGLEESLDNIITGFSDGFSVINDDGSTTTYFQNQIALMNHKTAIQSTVENAIKKSARLYYSRAYYDLDIDTLSYQRATDSKDGIWKGTFTLTSLTETDDSGVKISKTSPFVTIAINDNVELYIEQSIYRCITDIDKSKYGEITSLQMDFDTFKNKISLYSFSELERLKESFQACLNIIITADMFDEELHNKYYNFYRERFDYIDIEELPKRDEQLKCIQALYFFDSSTYETSGILYDIKNEVNRILNFKEYIIGNPLHYVSYDGENLWKTFCAYRREDKYTNSNYISDGLTNSEIIEKAKQLLDVAKKELYKAANLQLTLSANLNNLLILEEFQPLVDYFSCGNWIRVGIDEQIYRLRLLSYQLNFDDIPAIEVEFSTVEKLWSGDSDVKSILDSAKSIASSYSYTVQQVNNSSKSSKYVENWVEKGLDATATKIVNSADNQDIVIDRNGILCRKYDDISDIYDPCQTKIISNGLYTTNDGWKTISTGVGKICYIDPETGKEITDYGLIAKTVIGKLFIGENLGIYNSNGSLRFDGSGLTITNNKNTICISPNNNSKLIRITNSAREDVFYTDDEGNLKVSGTITAGSGSKIGNLSVGDNTLTYGNFGIDTSSTNSNNIALWLGNTVPSSASFRVTYDGKLYAKNGSFTGNIEATSGEIGGFSIESTGLTSYKGSDGYQTEITPNGMAILSKTTFISGGYPTTLISYIADFSRDGIYVKGIEIGRTSLIPGDFKTPLVTSTFLKGNQGNAIINSVAAAGNYVMLAKLNSTNGYFTDGVYNNGRVYYYTAKSTVDSGTNSATHAITLLDESGNTTLKTLNVTGNTTHVGHCYFANGTTYYISSAGNAVVNGMTAKGNASVAGTLTVTGKATITGGNITLNGAELIASANGTGFYLGPTTGTSFITTYIRGQYVRLYSTGSGGVYLGSSGSTAITSDENFKDLTEIDKRYEEFFYKLKPTLYQYKVGHRKHIGFGARAVEQALKESDIDNEEFAGLLIDKDINIAEDEPMSPGGETHFDEIYSLRYEEFISLNTLMIQKSLDRINKLEGENTELKSQIKLIKEQLDIVQRN